ncbi:hypothetical protein M0R45_003059 [Rubus argutus]|uniref:Uncharacterized protein n=1 Tax=Rubus argutus TaxID=59490 RepID=A0AAW1YFA6_RUBAR
MEEEVQVNMDLQEEGTEDPEGEGKEDSEEEGTEDPEEVAKVDQVITAMEEEEDTEDKVITAMEEEEEEDTVDKVDMVAVDHGARLRTYGVVRTVVAACLNKSLCYHFLLSWVVDQILASGARGVDRSCV